MLLIGFIAFALIGVSLGLIGAGGSILTIPVLVFLFHLPPVIATSYSFFIVGITSLNGAVGKYRLGEIHIGTAVTFSLVSMIIVVVCRCLLIPRIPQQLFSAGTILVTYNWASMSAFACLMIIASFFMVTNNERQKKTVVFANYSMIGVVLCAIMVGAVTGLLGVGGGFLIIPALTTLLDIEFKKAIGTSLAVIAFNSLCGFFNDLRHWNMDWPFLVSITLVSLIGSFSGVALSRYADSKQLKKYFGWSVLVIGILIIGYQYYQLCDKSKPF